MGKETQQSKLIADYLLGQLSQSEQEQLEEKYFTDNDVFIELLETEENLISDYLHQRLPRRERQLFEKHYISIPCNKQKVEFMQLMNQSEARQLILGKSRPTIQNSSSFGGSILAFLKLSQLPEWSRAVAALLIMAGAISLLGRYYTSTQTTPNMGKMSSPPPSVPAIGGENKPPGPQIVGLALASGSQRSGNNNPNTAYTDSNTRLIELRLKLVGYVYPKYKGRLQRVDEGIKEIESNDSLNTESMNNENVVLWKVEAARLPVGDYQVELQGVMASGDLGDTNSYDFSVRSR